MSIKRLPHWVLIDKFPAFYESESLTSIEQTARLYSKMNEMIESYNKYVTEINETIESFENETNADLKKFIEHISCLTSAYIRSVDLKLSQQDRKISEVYAAFSKDVQKTIDKLVAEMKESGEFDQVVLSHVKELTELCETMRLEFQQAKSELSEDYAETKRSLETDYQSTKSSLENEYQNTKTSLESDYTSKKSALDSDYQSTKTTLQNDYETTKTALQNDYETTKTQLQTYCMNEVDDFRDQYTQAEESLQAQYDTFTASVDEKLALGGTGGYCVLLEPIQSDDYVEERTEMLTELFNTNVNSSLIDACGVIGITVCRDELDTAVNNIDYTLLAYRKSDTLVEGSGVIDITNDLGEMSIGRYGLIINKSDTGAYTVTLNLWNNISETINTTYPRFIRVFGIK